MDINVYIDITFPVSRRRRLPLSEVVRCGDLQPSERLVPFIVIQFPRSLVSRPSHNYDIFLPPNRATKLKLCYCNSSDANVSRISISKTPSLLPGWHLIRRLF
jgi:hypothetical protein